ncbi:MAG: LysR family transcriptional regulator [Pseudomonadota bacterium]
MSNLDTQLKTFLQVARLGSFRRAAEEMFVTQAAITSRIQTLEEWLGFQVFDRHRRGADLTTQGHRFIDYARNALDTIEHGREDARRAQAYRAQYRFMTQYLLLESFSLDWLDWMREQLPDVSISIDSNHSMMATQEISKGQLDLAIGYQYKYTTGVVFEQLFHEKVILVTSMPDPDRWQGNYITTGWDESFDEEQRRFIGDRINHSPIHAEFMDAGRQLLKREACSAYVIERFAAPMIEQGLVQRVIEAPEFERPAYAIYPQNPAHGDIQAVALEGLHQLAKG